MSQLADSRGREVISRTGTSFKAAHWGERRDYLFPALVALLEWPRRPVGGAISWLRLPRGVVVLRKLSKEVSECCRLAEQAREWAKEATDPRIREDYLSVERSWLVLAGSYEFSESLTLFTSSQRRTRNSANL